MWERSLSMFTRGAGAPVCSGKGSLTEPASYELLMVIDDTATLVGVLARVLVKTCNTS